MDTVNLDANLYDMDTYTGRAAHFYRSVNPLNLFKDTSGAKDLIEKIKSNGGAIPSGMSREMVWDAKYVYDSAYHPTTGDLVFMPGRMSFQAPGNCIIASGMIIFYRTPIQAITGQLVNQCFNSTVNICNSPKPSFVPQDFAVAASSACFAAFGLNQLANKFGGALAARLVPFLAVCVANGINLPYMRRNEWCSPLHTGEGIPLMDENGNVVGHSPKIGQESITKVVLSRVIMATPTMVVPPLVVNALSKPGKFLHKNPAMTNPLTVALIGLALVAATPAACAIWPQQDATHVSNLEPHLQQRLAEQGISTVFFNKGL